MKPLRITDGYTEITAAPRGRMVEVFITEPGEGDVYIAHGTARLFFRLGIWCVLNWIFGRLCGLRDRSEAKKLRKQISEVPDVEYGDH